MSVRAERHFALTDELLGAAGLKKGVDPFIARVDVQDAHHPACLGGGTVEKCCADSAPAMAAPDGKLR